MASNALESSPAGHDLPGWRNRIVDSGEADPRTLLANPKNFRIHTEIQSRAMTGLLDEIGWVQNIIVNRATGHIMDGHMRVAESIRRGYESVPVVWVELTAAEEDAVLATFDPLAAMAETDTWKLVELVNEIDDSSIDELMAQMGYDQLLVRNPRADGLMSAQTLSRPPTLIWTLIGCPIDAYSDIAAAVAQLSADGRLIVESTIGG